MKYAPYSPITTTAAHISNGMRGIFQTIALMRSLVAEGRRDPVIRSAAISIIFLTPEKNQRAEIEACFNFVRDSVRYVRDIHDVETLATARKTLETMIGDCDDQSVLLASMLESIGYPTRFIVAGYMSADMVEHVFIEVQCDGQWIACDATEQEPMGWAPPNCVIAYSENLR